MKDADGTISLLSKKSSRSCEDAEERSGNDDADSYRGINSSLHAKDPRKDDGNTVEQPVSDSGSEDRGGSADSTEEENNSTGDSMETSASTTDALSKGSAYGEKDKGGNENDGQQEDDSGEDLIRQEESSEELLGSGTSLMQRLLGSESEEIVAETAELPLEHRGPPEQETSLSFWEYRVMDFFIVLYLSVKLYRYLIAGVMWYVNFLRLVAFVVLLLPGFAQMIVFYFGSPRLLRSVPYHPKDHPIPRNRLDVYLPRKRFRKRGNLPVIIYVTGGAWTIGYKAWGALFARRMSQRGVLVFCLDYRNFPQGTVVDMLEDINRGICWSMNNAFRYGGDPDNMYLVGQSAGGHLTSLALLAQCKREATGKSGWYGDTPAWNPRTIRSFVGVSGAYNLIELAEHLHKRGLYRNMFNAIMAGPDGSPRLDELSPVFVASEMKEDAAALMPKVLLLHGSGDKSVPIENAAAFCIALENAGVECHLKNYLNKTHTQPIVEDPMRGGRDKMMDDVLSLIRRKPCFNRQFPMLPSVCIDMASWFCPF